MMPYCLASEQGNAFCTAALVPIHRQYRQTICLKSTEFVPKTWYSFARHKRRICGRKLWRSVMNWRKTLSEGILLWLSTREPHYTSSVFEGVDSHRIIGCLAAVDRRKIDAQGWGRLWGEGRCPTTPRPNHAMNPTPFQLALYSCSIVAAGSTARVFRLQP